MTLRKRYLPQKTDRSRGPWLATLLVVAVVFTAVGVMIANNTGQSRSSRNGSSYGAFAAGFYPVVERDGEFQSPFVAVVEQVQDAVVNVSARSRPQRHPWWFLGPNQSMSSGSGFFFREDGYILTNNHVVEEAVQLTVRTSTGYEYEARLVGADPQTDLAVLKVEPEDEISVIPFGNSDDIRVGDWAIAIGNPFPQQGLDRTVTVGVISAIGRSDLYFGRETPDFQNYIQTDASINPGNSGGPLLNLSGECVGVNAAISSPTGVSVGIGFAIPINLARAIVPDLIATGKASRGLLGVRFHQVTLREAKRQGLEAVKGVTVDSVFSNSPAHKAGLRGGDIIIAYDGHPVESSGRFSVLVSTTREGTRVPIDVVRDGEQSTLYAIITDREGYIRSLPVSSSDRDDFQANVWLGMELLTFTPEISRAIGVKHVDGVFVRRVYGGSPADMASVVRGTIIMQVGDSPVATIDDVDAVASELGGSRRIPLIVREPDGTIARKVVRP